MRTILNQIPVSLAMCAAALSQSVPVALVAPPGQTQPAQAQQAAQIPPLVKSALANELQAAQDTTHPMRYKLRKTSPRLTTTKVLIETQDGLVAMLVAVNDKPLTQADLIKEQTRLQTLMTDPAKQRHRKQSEADDTARALKVLRELPKAFLYTDAGGVTTANGTVEKFTFVPNPKFNPPDLETQALTAISGELLVDPVQARVLRLDGHLEQDVDFGWGILGRLSKGGWIKMEQAEVGEGVWRLVNFQMKMTGRLLFRTRTFETTEEETNYTPVPPGLSYQQAIGMLRNLQPAVAAPAGGR